MFKCKVKWHIRTGYPGHIPAEIEGVYTYDSKSIASAAFDHYAYPIRNQQGKRAKQKWGHGRVGAVYGDMFGASQKTRGGPM